jgi:peptidoglycan/LPS O-acetylase OafA/YrhL
MLSGFVLAWSCADQPARPFWWRRFSRIWPLAMLGMVFAYTVIPGQEQIPGPGGRVAELLLVQAWSPDQAIYAGGNGVTWSLSVEMFCYLLFPAAIVLVRRLRGRGLAVAATVTVAAMLIPPAVISLAGLQVPASLYYWLFFICPAYRFGEFLLGMLLARTLALGYRVPLPGVACLSGVFCVAGMTLALTSFTIRTGNLVARPYVALLLLPFFALLLAASATKDLEPGGWWLGARPFVLLGEWSFALYLVHAPTMVVTAPLGWWDNPGGLAGLARFLAYLTLALAIAAVLHYLVEKPVEQGLRKLAPSFVRQAAAAR